MGKRVDPADTVDVALGFLQRWQAEGFGVEAVECQVEYQALPGTRRRLPARATVTVTLVSGRS